MTKYSTIHTSELFLLLSKQHLIILFLFDLNNIKSPINPFGVSLLSLAEGTHGYPKSAELQGDCGAYLSQLHSKLAREKKKYSPVSIIAENEEEFCEKQEQIVAEIMARSRTVIFCMGKCISGRPHLWN